MKYMFRSHHKVEGNNIYIVSVHILHSFVTEMCDLHSAFWSGSFKKVARLCTTSTIVFYILCINKMISINDSG